MCYMVVLYASMLALCNCEMFGDLATRDGNYDGQVMLRWVHTTYQFSTAVFCAAVCIANTRCASFYYNEVKQQCMNYLYVLDSDISVYLTVESGWQYYYIEGKGYCDPSKYYQNFFREYMYFFRWRLYYNLFFFCFVLLFVLIIFKLQWLSWSQIESSVSFF